MNHTKIRVYLSLFAICICMCCTNVQAQVAVKTNLLYDATTTPNLGLEVGVGSKNTIQLFYGLNAWKFKSATQGDRMAKHWLLMPEFRWWTCTAFNGFFYGIHAMGGQFNASNVNLPLPGVFFGGENLRSGVRSASYEGAYLGAGITCGYQWILSRHWNLEAEAGIGFNHVWYDKFACGECGPKLGHGQTNYAGLTKLGLTLLYIF